MCCSVYTIWISLIAELRNDCCYSWKVVAVVSNGPDGVVNSETKERRRHMSTTASIAQFIQNRGVHSKDVKVNFKIHQTRPSESFLCLIVGYNKPNNIRH